MANIENDENRMDEPHDDDHKYGQHDGSGDHNEPMDYQNDNNGHGEDHEGHNGGDYGGEEGFGGGAFSKDKTLRNRKRPASMFFELAQSELLKNHLFFSFAHVLDGIAE